MMNAPARGREPGLWKRAVLWLLLLAPFFFASYGFATWYTARRPEVPSLVFGWETQIPFWAWTIVPYWSIDLLYGFSLLLCLTRLELNRHALRLLSAQLIAVSCFLLWPLRFTFERPEMSGVFGWLFAVLAGFDKPFNQAPSLHIALLVVLWVCYSRHSQGFWHALVHLWFALIGVSVLTTWQHHFIDLPTGVLAGWFCVWLWPDDRPGPLLCGRLARDPKRLRLALYYGLGTMLCSLPAFALGGGWLWLLWPGVALAMVAFNYLYFGASGFQKQADGRLSAAVTWLLAPYLATAWLNSRFWTRRKPQPDQVCTDVWLGPILTRRTLRASPFKAVVDLCAELPLDARGYPYRSIALLDLCAPSAESCLQAAEAIETLRTEGSLLVCCALGYSRSATAVVAWLLHSGRAASVEQAIALVAAARPGIVLRQAHHQALEAMLQLTAAAAPSPLKDVHAH
ncbi:phosphatase PAP2/dual specificity phosphatase family protein [Pseudomonas sp. LS1212]|uniref:phosphatase PAP2/dual specificity phosphatase family protein n=1 Tax=Pseudomonas sp. LS1212 TaxID=2972478 RepID=UPI00215C6883|nr:phosphatase PAP2/dual specificity phosphatase family protein [Pseudomonas sp. LS1212]UVJ42928.1 phosphatase PAP2/dual specificity phosphatase family protein [Pseudomonas sp. LS1212]